MNSNIKKIIINSIVSFSILVLWNIIYIFIEINCYKNNDMFLGWPLFLFIALPANILFIFLIVIVNRIIFNASGLYMYIIVILLGLVQTFSLFRFFISSFEIGWWLTYIAFSCIYILILVVFKIKEDY